MTENQTAGSLSNVLKVVEYLTAQGWKIKRSAAYQHVQEKKLQHNASGTFALADVETYATKYLKHLDGSNVKKALEKMQERKITAEVESVEYEARIKKIKAEAIEGKFILREIFENEIAAQALAFRNTLHTFIHASSEEIVHLVAGDASLISDLIEFLKDKADTHFFKAAEDMEAIVNAALARERSRDQNDENENPDDDETDTEGANHRKIK
jgi:hypothetical protein